MGPFETIDLNAPKGVNDYCERYAGGICRVLKKQVCSELSEIFVYFLNLIQDNSREWEAKTWTKINDAMAESVPRDQLKNRLQWRNERLFELAQLKAKQEKEDSKKQLPWADKSKL